MKKEVKAAIITGIFGLVGTITASVIGVAAGKTVERENILNEVQSMATTITGDNNQIVFNNISEFASNYVDLSKEYEKLQDDYVILRNSYNQVMSELNEEKGKFDSLQQAFDYLSNNYNIDILSKPSVEYSNISLIINGIESGYVDRVAIINNETFYSVGFLNYLVDNQAVFSDTSKLFIGNVQSEDKMPVSLFDMEPFTDGYLWKESNMEDNYGNIYEEAFKIHTINNDYYENLINGAQEYYLNNSYSKFAFDVFYAKEADQETDYEIFVYGDGKQLKTYTIDRKTKLAHIEVDVQGVEFLQIVGRHTYSSHIYTDTYYFGITNPYLYP